MGTGSVFHLRSPLQKLLPSPLQQSLTVTTAALPTPTQTHTQGDDAPKKVMLGRPGNNVKVGIVGVPNVGKSSFFNILGKMNVPAENFPFCTIDPNVAIVPVPDQRFKWLCKKYKPASEVPPNMTITDIAGLVKVRAAKHVEEMKRVIVRTCHP